MILRVDPGSVAPAYEQLITQLMTAVRTPRAAPDDDEVRAAAILFVGAARRAGLDLPGALGAIRGTW